MLLLEMEAEEDSSKGLHRDVFGVPGLVRHEAENQTLVSGVLVTNAVV